MTERHTPSTIFTDDSSPADKREAALNLMMDMCPSAYRVAFKPMVSLAISNATDEQVATLASDIRRVRALANDGDVAGIADIARRYGATDAMINQYLPLFMPDARPAA